MSSPARQYKAWRVPGRKCLTMPVEANGDNDAKLEAGSDRGIVWGSHHSSIEGEASGSSTGGWGWACRPGVGVSGKIRAHPRGSPVLRAAGNSLPGSGHEN